MPDLFANMRVKQPESFFQYQKVKPIGEKEIPENYVKFIEPVFPEEQNTIEKCWSFNTKIYEI